MKVNKILITRNLTRFGILFRIKHSVFVTTDNKIVSFEGKHSFSKRKVCVYDLEQYYNSIDTLERSIKIKPFNIKPHLSDTGYYSCHEWITKVCMLNNIPFPFSELDYNSLISNANKSIRYATIYLLYIATIPIIVAMGTYLLTKPKNIEQCLKTFNIEITKYEN